jgi:hypothetical protein
VIADNQTRRTVSSSNQRPGVARARRPSELSPLSGKCLDQHSWVFVPVDLMTLAGDANAGLLLARINYWFGCNGGDESTGRAGATRIINEQRWLPKTRASFARETGLTEKQVKLALAKLLSMGLVERLGHTELLRPTHLEVSEGGRGMKVWSGLVRMAGSAAGGLVLAQLHYWTSDARNKQTRLRVNRDGFWWLAKGYEAFGEETGLKPRQVRSAVDRLHKQGIIQTSSYRFSGMRTLHLRFDDAGFECAWEEQEISRLERRAQRR